MPQFKVGDVVQLLQTSMWVTSDSSEKGSSNPVGIDGVITYCAHDGNYYEIDWSNGLHNSSYTDNCLCLISVDCLTVSSLDYMTNKELSEEDKLIIKEALTNV